jgi:glycosyltransferase involved in cell wall biosynthesis
VGGIGAAPRGNLRVALSRRLRVVLNASPLRDARGAAGIGRYVAQLAPALERLDSVDLSLATPWWRPPAEAWWVRYLSAQPAAIASLRHRPDVIHSADSDPVLGFPLARQVVTVQDIFPWAPEGPDGPTRSGAYVSWQLNRIRRAGAVLTTSSAVGEEAAGVLGVDRSRIHVVPLGVAATFSPTPSPQDAAARIAVGVPESGYVLWVGSLQARDPRKALDDLVAAAAALTALRPTLVLAGRAGLEAERLRALAGESNVRMVVTGYVSDDVLAALYRGAAVVVVPSMHEGFGLPALEAMASGAPLVASSGGNLPDLVGDAGVLVPAGDPRVLAAAIRGVLEDAQVRSRLARAGPPRAAPYTWQATAGRTVAVYQGVAEQAGARPGR